MAKTNTAMNGWTNTEKKAAEAEARRTGVTADEVAKNARQQHLLFSRRGALYRADILG